MANNMVMRGRDAVSAKLAECFITIDGNRFNFMQAIDFEAKFERTKTKVPILGRTGMGNKSTGWRGSGKATFHYNSSVFRDMMLRYKNSGEDVYFEIQISNNDPASSVGRQTVVFVDCNIDGGILAKFDANGEYLDEKLEFTFEDFRMPQRFRQLSGMR
ncbi:MAG: phage tail tube protein [Oscillospiraceae bacterium]|nr:phage tail tube protein [Oscillospiraceae bacterium]